MRFHAGSLRTAALLAAVFVATRVVYRIIFGGASGGGILLLDLPRIPLSGPFAFVSLFGPITSDGLWNAAISALPFAAVILAFGLINTVFDVQRLFVAGSTRGPLRAISRSLVIAWSTAPALAQSVRRLRQAAALRGERSASRLLIPVFEQTIERAVSLAASMEVRGFAARHPKPSTRTRLVASQGKHPSAEGVPSPHAAEFVDVSLGHDGEWLLSRVNLRVERGTLTVLVGPTGSGKSTLLRSIDGLFQHFDGGQQRGTIIVEGIDRASTPPRETAALVGSVAQNVRLGFATATVRDEIGFALAVQAKAAEHVEARVIETCELLGITHLLDRDIVALSAGEATLVALASALITEPTLLLIDEPLAELDDNARKTVCHALDRLAHEHNVAVVVAEHQIALWTHCADQWLEISAPQVRVSASVPNLTAVATSASRIDEWRVTETPRPQHPLAQVQHLEVGHGESVVVREATFELAAGETVALAGANGVGKSSLLLAMALADAPGHVLIAGDDVATLPPRERRRRVALVPERVEEIFFQTTVAAECQRADKLDRPATATAHTFAELLGRNFVFDIDELLLLHPHDLSAGQQLCLAIAIQLAPSPAVLLVDEPSRGLDPVSRALVGKALQRAAHIAESDSARTVAGAATTAASGSRAVLFATHDVEFAHSFASRQLRLIDGQLQADAPAATVSSAATAIASVAASSEAIS